jgi:hypothetical protein
LTPSTDAVGLFHHLLDLPVIRAVSRGAHGRTLMRIHNLYTDAKGESHFRDIEVEWVE